MEGSRGLVNGLQLTSLIPHRDLVERTVSYPKTPCEGQTVGSTQRRWSLATSVSLIQTNLHFHTRGQIQFHQRIHGLIRGFDDVQQPFMSANFVLITRIFIHMR